MGNEENFAGDIQEVELSMEQVKESIALQAALARLSENEDFIAVITKGFFNEEAERVVGALADPAMIVNEPGMKMLENIIITIGGLRQYFIKLQQQGNMSSQALEELQQTHTELLQEQMEASES